MTKKHLYCTFCDELFPIHGTQTVCTKPECREQYTEHRKSQHIIHNAKKAIEISSVHKRKKKHARRCARCSVFCAPNFFYCSACLHAISRIVDTSQTYVESYDLEDLLE